MQNITTQKGDREISLKIGIPSWPASQLSGIEQRKRDELIGSRETINERKIRESKVKETSCLETTHTQTTLDAREKEKRANDL